MEIKWRQFQYLLELPPGTILCFLFHHFHLHLHILYYFSNPHSHTLVSGIFLEVGLWHLGMHTFVYSSFSVLLDLLVTITSCSLVLCLFSFSFLSLSSVTPFNIREYFWVCYWPPWSMPALLWIPQMIFIITQEKLN